MDALAVAGPAAAALAAALAPGALAAAGLAAAPHPLSAPEPPYRLRLALRPVRALGPCCCSTLDLSGLPALSAVRTARGPRGKPSLGEHYVAKPMPCAARRRRAAAPRSHSSCGALRARSCCSRPPTARAAQGASCQPGVARRLLTRPRPPPPPPASPQTGKPPAARPPRAAVPALPRRLAPALTQTLTSGRSWCRAWPRCRACGCRTAARPRSAARRQGSTTQRRRRRQPD